MRLKPHIQFSAIKFYLSKKNTFQSAHCSKPRNISLPTTKRLTTFVQLLHLLLMEHYVRRKYELTY